MQVLPLFRVPQRTAPAAVLIVALTALCSAACNALDAPGPKGSVVLIPTDVRAAQLTATPPPPISGGTLAISPDGKLAVAADPDRDRVSIVDLERQSVQHIALSSGDEPGRVLIDDSGRAFVALRRGGALAVIDLARGELQQRVPVCAAPRGMAFDAAQRLVHVACQDGHLLSVGADADAAQPTAAALKVLRDVPVGLDLRDVMWRGNQLWVSSFKQVQLTQIGPDGGVLERVTPGAFVQSNVNPFGTPGAKDTRMLQPHVAYRSLTDAAGNLVVLHQAESTDEVAIDQPADGDQGRSPYGGTGTVDCGGIVTPALTLIDPQGGVTTLAANSGVLSVDMAYSPDSDTLAVVQAGGLDPKAPERQTVFDSDGFGSAQSAPPSFFGGQTNIGSPDDSSTVVSMFGREVSSTSCRFGQSLRIGGQSTAIALRRQPVTDKPATGQETWVVQSREPARLTMLSVTNNGGASGTVIDLGGDSVRDTGHDLFHHDAGAGVACASCHAEGAEDGHVWSFTRLGLRRTQALHVGLEGTAPFHWAGDETDLNHLMSDVFVGRMGGVHQSDERVAALSQWLFALQPPAAPVIADGAAVERGQALFQSPAVGCAGCHSGDKLTNNQTVDVGTGEALQVPSLRGIAYRAPFMHNGCALTLRDRFSPACGGSAHGNTLGLASGEIDDLVSYLQTL